MTEWRKAKRANSMRRKIKRIRRKIQVTERNRRDKREEKVEV